MAAVRIAVNEEGLKAPLLWSLLAHALLAASLTISTLLSHQGAGWGGPGGGAVSVKLVGGLAGVPLPRPETVTPSRVVDTSKGLYKSEPIPKPKAPPSDAREIPEFKKEPKRLISDRSKVLEDNTPPPPNAVPYGGGGAASVPYSEFTLGSSGTTTAGMGFSGPGGGDFGNRFSWYVDAVRSRVSSNWLQSTVESSVRFAPRAVVSFDILRSGTITNVQVTRSSGNSSVDNSAVRAVLSSNPAQALPNEYSGSKVSVEFWFDFKR